ncbi:Putative uncharacterized oxidoreductase [Psilocybe cubensis]|uniref:Uncharacterized oxidoreductase n=2 Tax=Psilocybe cubensis TaxID=181762 RepID=A0ACB8GKA7_PSICU|nr:Putative uncharacterized oxidoreductase [Psilocybe cubensis]KAH9475832.1 Putative uncharacterized oxidoreductase [Psilocybe cubensis]
MSKQLILVTGISGFIGGHVAEELLKHGFRVRGTVRGAKYHTFVNTVKRPDLEFVEVDDVVTGDFTKALEGVEGVIHTACPLPGKKNLEELLSIAVQGTLNVVRQAQQAGVKKIVVTSSFGALLSPTHMPAFHGINFTENMWGEVDDQELEKNKDEKYYVYFTAKIKAERALWAFASEHPELEVATILPGCAIGPYAQTFPLPANSDTMATNDFVLLVLSKQEPPFAPNWMVDVRDVGKAHVLALEKLPLPSEDPKRFTVNSATYTWGAAAAYIKESRPELADRLFPLEDIKPLPGVLSTLDTTRAKEILGFDEFIPVEKALDEAVNAVLELEKRWSSNDI